MWSEEEPPFLRNLEIYTISKLANPYLSEQHINVYLPTSGTVGNGSNSAPFHLQTFSFSMCHFSSTPFHQFRERKWISRRN